MNSPTRHISSLFKLPIIVGVIFVSSLFSNCQFSDNRDTTAIPRPKAFPRQQLYDTTRTIVAEAAPLKLYANSESKINIPEQGEQGRWINIVYPLYRATIYCTITPVTSQNRQEVIDNRVERMSLNAGGLTTEIISIESHGGFHSQLLTTPVGALTPLQFLSTDDKNWVVSGTVYFESIPSASAADSIAPSINAIKNDLIYALSHLESLKTAK